MVSRLTDIRANAGPGSQAVHVWGREFEDCAVACELAGTPVVRLESGGFCTEWNITSQAQVHSGQFRVEHEILDWQVVQWRELGRELFKPTVADQEEEEHSQMAEWGTDDLAPRFHAELDAAVADAAQRLQLAMVDDVLVMCTWRVFDRQRGLLTARYGLGSAESEDEVNAVLAKIPVSEEERTRLRHLWTAAQAWW